MSLESMSWETMSWETMYATRADRMRASEIRELLKLLDQPDIISFAGGIPDPQLFPDEAFRTGFQDALSDGRAGDSLQYSVSEGYPPLRQWIMRQMAAIGVPCAIDNVLITSGSQQALDYLGKLFLSPSDTALVSWPTYLGALQAFNAYEPRYDRLNPAAMNVIPAVYADGAAQAGGRVKFAYLTPDFANPTGETLDLRSRELALALGDELDIALIEDAAYQALRYDGSDEPSLLSLDIARTGDIDRTRTIYCGSFSKTLAPGLRVGWVCAAQPVIRKLVLMKQAADLHSASINQVVIHHVAEHGFEAQILKIRAAYRARRDLMLAALQLHMPAGVTWTRPEGGMFIWLTLPEGVDGAQLLRRATATARVAFVPGRAFHADGSGANTLRLSFSLADETSIALGIERLGRLIADTGAMRG